MKRSVWRYLILGAGLVLLVVAFGVRWYTASRPPTDLERLSLEELEARADVLPGNHWVQLELGARYAEMGADEAAIQRLRRCLAVAPNTAKAHFYLGVIHQRRGQFLEAAKWLETATAQDSAFADAHRELARAYYSLHNYRRALTAIQHYIRLVPENAEGYYVEGNIYAIEGKMDKAERSYQRAVRLAPQRAATHLALGQCHLYYRPTPRRLQRAAQCFEKALQLEPDAADVCYHLGLVRLRQGRWEQAAKTLQRALRLDPHYPQTHHALGQAYLRLGKPQQAQEHLARFEQLRNTIEGQALR